MSDTYISLEANIKPTGEDSSTEFSYTLASNSNEITFVVKLMNKNAEAQIDLIIADYPGVKSLTVTSLGKNVLGNFVQDNERQFDRTKRYLIKAAIAFVFVILFTFVGMGFSGDLPELWRNPKRFWKQHSQYMLGVCFAYVVFALWIWVVGTFL